MRVHHANTGMTDLSSVVNSKVLLFCVDLAKAQCLGS